MKTTIDNLVEASCALWLDNVLIEQNSGFLNYSGAFHKTDPLINGYTAFSAPHRQFVYDSSISGAIVPSGAVVGGVATPTGANLVLDYYRGQALFPNTNPNNVSAAYSYKEVNVYFTSNNAQTVLFENKFTVNPRSAPANDTFNAKDLVYPCIFIKTSVGDNTTLSFDGCSTTDIKVRLILLADTYYLYKTVTSILRDKKETWMAVFNPSEMPFNYLYSLQNGSFDYSQSVKAIQTDPNRLAYIKEVAVSDFQDKINNDIAPNMFGGFIDLTLELLRFPRS